MAGITAEQARRFVSDLSLPPARQSRTARAAEAPVAFDPSKDQALVVASDIIAFTKG